MPCRGKNKTMKMNRIIRSMLLVEQEKLVLLSEEIKYLYDICRFHSKENNENEPRIKQDLELNFKIIQSELEVISKKKIKGLFDKINTLISNEIVVDIDNRQLLFYIDYYRYKVNKIIKKLKIINQKISQMFRDGYDQYISKPTPGRMFSNINLTAQVEQNLKKRYEEFIPDKESNSEINVQVIWEYSGSYRVTKYPKEAIDPRILIFRMSYWYFDLPIFIPMLTHELGHIATDKTDFKNTKNELISQLKDKIGEDFLVSDAFKDKTEYYIQLSNEIFADILSLFYHGDAYLLTIIHSLLGYHLAGTFDFDEDNNSILISSWSLEYKRDSAFIRIYILLKIRKDLKQYDRKDLFREDFDDILLESSKLLDLVYGKEKEGFEDYYLNWHNYLNDFRQTQHVILYLRASFTNFFDKNQDKLKSKFEEMQGNTEKDIEDSDFIPKHFNDIWITRFKKDKDKDEYPIDKNKISHKFEFRKRIHRNTLTTLMKNKMLDKEDLKSYELIYYKYKLNNLNDQEKKSLKDKLDPEVKEDSASKNQENITYTGYVFGIYDQVKFKKFDDNWVRPKLKEIKDEEKRYISKNSLMKVLKDFSKSNDGNKNSLQMNLIVHIDIMKNLGEDDIYNDLTEDIKKIYRFFNKNEKYNYTKVETYKTLGSKDLVVFIQGLDIDSLYKIKKDISSMFPRTFSMITYTDKNERSLGEDYLFFTEIRMNKKFDKEDDKYIDNIKDVLENYENKIVNVYDLTGIMDYRIIWNKETTLKDVSDFYIDLVDFNYISDIQTRIVKDTKLFEND